MPAVPRQYTRAILAAIHGINTTRTLLASAHHYTPFQYDATLNLLGTVGIETPVCRSNYYPISTRVPPIAYYYTIMMLRSIYWDYRHQPASMMLRSPAPPRAVLQTALTPAPPTPYLSTNLGAAWRRSRVGGRAERGLYGDMGGRVERCRMGRRAHGDLRGPCGEGGMQDGGRVWRGGRIETWGACGEDGGV
eukprot:1611191-Rhodomonas_salina.1